MTVKAFKETFQEDLESKVIKESVDRTSNVAYKFIDKTLVKSLRNNACQTESIEEIFQDYRN